MKKYLFYAGVIAILLFEIAHVYFIMPMPGSQEINSIQIAYFLESWKWLFRSAFAGLILAGISDSFKKNKFFTVLALLIIAAAAYLTNYEMAADTMFYQPKSLKFADAAQNVVGVDKLVIGIENEGESKAYPIQFLGYHHQVADSIGNKPVMITYCTVCRTGRVYEPVVNGKHEKFRLVGMDHFNAMFEDETTKSWWRQATGEACAGKLKGKTLPEFPSSQMTLKKWLDLNPNSLIMQPDQHFQAEYDSMLTYEGGRLTGKLTRRDTLSWQAKSWVAGVVVGQYSKAYDWKKLQQQKVILDRLGNIPIAVLMASDQKSITGFIRTGTSDSLYLRGDTIFNGRQAYLFNGKCLTPEGANLEKINVYQEYWHSWMQFHPYTTR